MAKQSPNYKKLFLKEQRRREDEQRRRKAAEQAQKEEEHRREAAEQAQKEEERRREATEQAQDRAKEKTRKTTLLEFLNACYTYLHSTSDFALEQHFTLLHMLEESRQAILQTELEDSIGSMTAQNNLLDGPKTVAAPRARTARLSWPRANQFCVYNTSIQNRESRMAAYITEYKPPHKLPLGCIYEGLEDMELDEVVWCRETDTPRDRFRRLIAAVITQAFSYMVKLGVEYGCVCTGEAIVFLRVPNDPRTVHYFLSVPKGDVGGATGWAPDSDGPNRLHLTAVGQMLAFTLQALKTPPRSHQWRVEAASRLNSWEVVYEDLLDAIPQEDAPSSEYRPPRHDGFLRMSPVQLRRRYTPIRPPSCARPQDQHADSDEEPDPDTPSRRQPSPQGLSRIQATSSSSPSQSSRRGQSGQYCTQNCLLRLVNRGPLNMSCLNLLSNLDTNCKPVSLPSACGVLFQGIHVLVYLGNIDLATLYYYEVINFKQAEVKPRAILGVILAN
ncbi:hypothetical protein BCR34DRAFT_629093 [Clohesyomyces aquaticus]|uniref:Uncharacterized protein n=1 Tax=Clohesyomyces aquaticus TaxID=1231657 RepID=A0A1Y1YAY9_9PLEO|nr:hypothetical protein BCR34DRAFT_629093 [Clohesyomyces aquaticus]